MNRFFLSAVLALSLSGPLSAQTDSLTYSLEAVAVTGSRVPVRLGQSARMVTLLDSVAIARMPAETVNDILKYAIGVDVRQRGVFGMQTDISVRGGTGDQIAVLLNGVYVGDPQTGHNAVDFPVDKSQIDRIEILEGPAALVYGTSSLVGAINIVTKAVSPDSGTLHLYGGSYGYLGAGGGLGFSTGKVINNLSLGLSRSDGYLRSGSGSLNSDFKSFKFFYRGSFNYRNADVCWQAGISDKGFGSNTFYSSKYDDQFEKTFKSFLSVQAETKGFIHFRPVIYWNRYRDRFELFRGDASRVPFNYHRTDVLGLNMGAWMETRLGKTAFGMEIRNEDIVSTNLGDPLPKPLSVPGKDVSYVSGRSRTNTSAYVQHNVILDRLTVSAGVTAVRNSGNDAGVGFYPEVDASLRLLDYWKLYASYNSSLRQPTFTELYYSVGGHKADSRLKPERMRSIEGGVKFLRNGISAIVSVYYHRGKDMIDWVRDISEGPDALWTSVNFTRINTLGEELTLRLSIPELLERETFPVRSINFGCSHISQDKVELSGIQSLYALEYLRNKIVAQADLGITDKLTMNVSWSRMDRVGTSDIYSPYSLLDSRLSWDNPSNSIYLEAKNILDRVYYDHGDIPQPGIWIIGGVVVLF